MAKGKFGGFGGGMNMQAMMKQAQKMQENMLKAQEEIAQMEDQIEELELEWLEAAEKLGE